MVVAPLVLDPIEVEISTSEKMDKISIGEVRYWHMEQEVVDAAAYCIGPMCFGQYPA